MRYGVEVNEAGRGLLSAYCSVLEVGSSITGSDLYMHDSVP